MKTLLLLIALLSLSSADKYHEYMDWVADINDKAKAIYICEDMWGGVYIPEIHCCMDLDAEIIRYDENNNEIPKWD